MKLLGKPKLGKGLRLKISMKSVPGLPKSAGNKPIAKVPGVQSPGAGVPGVKSPMKTGTGGSAVKTPKAKSMPDATDKPSVFFKNEDLSTVKHPSAQKLRDFLSKARSKK